ncbi:MAG: hypothetical protein IAF02_17275 [Anaerolineae bacterium]|nr:hypothetical protein [Anaerolineae bacterium]
MSRFILKIMIGAVLLTTLILSGCTVTAQTQEPLAAATAVSIPTATAVLTAIPTPDSFTCDTVSEIPVSECQALVALYNATAGPNWQANDGWLQTATPCSWAGVGCVDNHVNTLELVNNNLQGQLPAALADLTALARLHLRQNQLEGEIPFALGELSGLSAIDLTFNQLTGTIPSALFQVPDHRFWGNALEGTIFVAENGQQVNYLGAEFTVTQAVADSVFPELTNVQPPDPWPALLWTPPEHILVTFASEAAAHDHAPLGLYLPSEGQLHIYPAAELNAEVQPIVAALQQLLAEQPDLTAYAVTNPETAVDQTGLTMLPPSNAQQLFRAQAQYISFAEGSGVRYLTQLNQGPVPANNQELFYTFQGLTADGSTYVAAYFPVTLPDLPASGQVSDEAYAAMLADWQGYLTETLDLLNEQPPDAFTPSLAELDALINSLSVAGTTAVPQLTVISPDNGASVDSQPVLQWQSYPGAVSYQVIVLDDDAYPPVVVLDQTTSDTSMTVTTPLEPGSYSWTVWAHDADGKVLAELNSAFLVADE